LDGVAGGILPHLRRGKKFVGLSGRCCRATKMETRNAAQSEGWPANHSSGKETGLPSRSSEQQFIGEARFRCASSEDWPAEQ